jgi:hypothetical protein
MQSSDGVMKLLINLALCGAFFILFSSPCLAFSIGDVSSTEITSKDQVVDVVLDLSSIPSNPSYFRVAFTKSNSSPSYFGKIKNDNGEWVTIGTLGDCTNYYYVENPSTLTNLTLQVKFAEEKDSGGYYLRAHRLSAGCSSSHTSEFFPVEYSGASPSPSPSSSPSPSPVPSSAYYKINMPKDKDGLDIDRVKVYVDDVYVHHWAPENLEFCEDCICGNDEDNTSCSFGEHNIALKKEGYLDWHDKKMIKSGDGFTVNPVMDKISGGGSGSSDEDEEEEDVETPLASPTNLYEEEVLEDQPGEVERELPEIKEQVLGEKAENENGDDKKEDKKKLSLSPPLIISLVGGLCLIGAAYPFIGPVVSNFIRRLKKGVLKRNKLFGKD